MTTHDVLEIVASNALLFALLQFIASTWLKARLEASIRSEYDRRLEQYRRELDRREKATMVAELFAEWMSHPDDLKHLNRLTWEASLWLPSHLVKAVSKRLHNSADAQDIKEILVEVRQHLSGADDDVRADELVHFTR